MSSVSRHVPTEDGDLYIPLPTARHASRPRRLRNVELIAGLLLLMLSGCANFILLKVLFAAYGESAAFFVSQGINVIYCVYGGLIVYPRLLPSGVGDALSRGFGLEPITPRMRTWPHLRAFVVMGVLDCFGTFLTAMGAVYTPGQFQTLLNQSLIPATMAASALFLHERYSTGQLGAAALLVSGAVISVVPSLLPSHHAVYANDEARWYAVALYWLSNVPMALSAVYKEAHFAAQPMDVTQWVSIWQMLFGFALAPLMLLPGVGTARGMRPGEIASSFADGAACFAERDAACTERHAFALLCVYVGVNFCFNTLGLWLTKHAGAVLNSISYALLLPLTTLGFSLPVLGPYRESANAMTYAGLAVVLAGFVLWRYHSLVAEAKAEPPLSVPALQPSPRQRRLRVAAAAIKLVRRLSLDCSPSPPPGEEERVIVRLLSAGGAAEEGAQSFQERVVGMGPVARSRERSCVAVST